MSGEQPREPGWYPDPIRPEALDTARWWDGRAWTEKLRAATRAERREWYDAQLAASRAEVADIRARAEAGDPDARAIVMAATSLDTVVGRPEPGAARQGGGHRRGRHPMRRV